MGKVAFLALTYGDFVHPIMQDFFGTDSDSYNLYIHNKIDCNIFRQFCIPNRINTAWGHHSLVTATINLMKEALLDEDNTHFILISDSHAPLYNMETMCKKIKENYPILSFTKFPPNSGASIEVRFKYGLLFNSGKFRLRNACKVHQWFVCTRPDVELFVRVFRENERFFVKARNTYTDEFYFHLIANTYEQPFQFSNNCSVEWFKETLPITQQLLGCRETPYTYESIDTNTIDDMRANGNVFCRKVYAQTQLPFNYVFND